MQHLPKAPRATQFLHNLPEDAVSHVTSAKPPTALTRRAGGPDNAYAKTLEEEAELRELVAKLTMEAIAVQLFVQLATGLLARPERG